MSLNSWSSPHRRGGFMTRRSAARALAGLPIALSLTIGLAFAQDSSTTVPKSPSSTDPVEQEGGPPEDALRPSIGQDVVPADNAAPVGEMTPSAIDEGASTASTAASQLAPSSMADGVI